MALAEHDSLRKYKRKVILGVETLFAHLDKHPKAQAAFDELWRQLRNPFDPDEKESGISSGAAVAGAAKVAAKMDSGTIVTLLPDGGWKYLSSGAWTDDLDVVEERATRVNYW